MQVFLLAEGRHSQHGCSPVNLLHIFRTRFYKNTSGWLLLKPQSLNDLLVEFQLLLLVHVTFPILIKETMTRTWVLCSPIYKQAKSVLNSFHNNYNVTDIWKRKQSLRALGRKCILEMWTKFLQTQQKCIQNPVKTSKTEFFCQNN